MSILVFISRRSPITDWSTQYSYQVKMSEILQLALDALPYQMFVEELVQRSRRCWNDYPVGAMKLTKVFRIWNGAMWLAQLSCSIEIVWMGKRIQHTAPVRALNHCWNESGKTNHRGCRDSSWVELLATLWQSAVLLYQHPTLNAGAQRRVAVLHRILANSRIFQYWWLSNPATHTVLHMMEEQHTEAIIDRDVFWNTVHISTKAKQFPGNTRMG